MTSYGTIPTSTSPPPGAANLGYISRAKVRIIEGLGTRRPWGVMFNYHSFNLPGNLTGAVSRLKTNVAYFRMNYVILALLIIFLSLLWHPISLIVFLVMMVAWLFLYFLRDEPLVIARRTINDRTVVIVLGVLTVVFLLLTHATWNVVGSVLIGVVVVVIHGIIRKTDDLFLDEESTGLMSSAPAGGASSSSPAS